MLVALFLFLSHTLDGIDGKQVRILFRFFNVLMLLNILKKTTAESLLTLKPPSAAVIRLLSLAELDIL